MKKPLDEIRIVRLPGGEAEAMNGKEVWNRAMQLLSDAAEMFEAVKSDEGDEVGAGLSDLYNSHGTY